MHLLSAIEESGAILALLIELRADIDLGLFIGIRVHHTLIYFVLRILGGHGSSVHQSIQFIVVLGCLILNRFIFVVFVMLGRHSGR